MNNRVIRNRVILGVIVVVVVNVVLALVQNTPASRNITGQELRLGAIEHRMDAERSAKGVR